MENQQNFDLLMKKLRSCHLCEDGLPLGCRPIVRGQQKVAVFQISQAPGLRVHTSGLPFDDASGQKLRKEWYGIDDALFYDEAYFYITSMGHCYPGKATSGDKLPPRICAKTWLMRELDSVDTQLYIIIGALAAGFLFGKQPLADLIRQDQVLYGKQAFVLPHPSPLNRKWLKDHPWFEEERLPYIREQLHLALQQRNIMDKNPGKNDNE